MPPAPGGGHPQYQAPSRQQLAATQPAGRQQPASQKRKGGWKVVAQFVLGLAVIVVVAAAIVWLYVRYYQ
jgi:hypothetical protein